MLNMIINKNHRSAMVAAGSTGLLLAFLLMTSPDEDNFALSFVPLVLMWLAVYSASGAIMNFLFKNPRKVVVSVLKTALASVSTLMVMFSALGQVSIADVVVLLSLVLLGSFYFDRTWRK